MWRVPYSPLAMCRLSPHTHLLLIWGLWSSEIKVLQAVDGSLEPDKEP